MAGIYLHIPFCKQACYYCDFHFSTSRAGQHELVNAIGKELILRKNYIHSEEVETIYFGGGTPSLLSSQEMDSLFHIIKNNYKLTSTPEITLEANPDDLSEQKLNELIHSGFNRLSIGIQSFNDHVLKYLNRAHTSLSALQSFHDARRAGFLNISIDLIYSIPGQSDSRWCENIQQAIALKPEHISAYSLTIEEKTVFGHRAAQGSLTPVDDDSSAQQLEILMDELKRAGYDHYEVSNFCLPGFHSRHNSSYWKQARYLGVGPSAHSYDGISRQFNINNNGLYTRSLVKDEVPFQLETLSREDHINEFLLTTLRTTWGCDVEKLTKQFSHDILTVRHSYLQDLFNRELAFMDGNHLKLTRKGWLLADKIAADLFVSPS